MNLSSASTALSVRDPWALVPSLGNLDAYISAVNRLPMLTQEEETRFARRLRDEADVESAGRLVLSHLRLVVSVSRQYLGYGLPHGDLIQEGNVGLMKAVKRFDPEAGVRLVSYALHWIKAEIHEYILKNWRMVKLATTKAQRKLFFNLRSMKQGLKSDASDADAHRNNLSAAEIDSVARALNVKPAEVIEMETRMSGGDVALEPQTDDGEEAYAPIAYLADDSGEPTRVLEARRFQRVGGAETLSFKARVVAGDEIAGEMFLRNLRPFIWRKHLDFAAIHDIHSIKRQIHAHKKLGGLSEPDPDLKIGRGGIREIEFFAQTQQLILGGRVKFLRERRTSDALAALVQREALDEAGRVAQGLNAELVVEVRLRGGTPERAAANVAYMNQQKRYAARYWEVGNEPDRVLARLLRKAVGARRVDILGQFLVEAMVLSLVGSTILGSRGARRAGEIDADRREYLLYLDALEECVGRTASEQHRWLYRNHPPPDALWNLAGTDRMWQRRWNDEDFTETRVGIGERPLRHRLVAAPATGDGATDPVTTSALDRLLTNSVTVPEVPVTVVLNRYRRIEVGDDRGLSRAMVCQLASWHGPDQLKIGVVTGSAEWDWLKWLPHHYRSGVIGGASLRFADGQGQLWPLRVLTPDEKLSKPIRSAGCVVVVEEAATSQGADALCLLLRDERTLDGLDAKAACVRSGGMVILCSRPGQLPRQQLTAACLHAGLFDVVQLSAGRYLLTAGQVQPRY